MPLTFSVEICGLLQTRVVGERVWQCELFDLFTNRYDRQRRNKAVNTASWGKSRQTMASPPSVHIGGGNVGCHLLSLVLLFSIGQPPTCGIWVARGISNDWMGIF